MSKKQVPVLLLTGYLGSGKTTLVNRILSNRKGIRFAVIVNDIGEVNSDAALIQKGGVVGTKDDSLVALQNGCICCTLKMDLVQQLSDIVAADRFDYIVIEASGICEPEPIAQTICSIPSLDPRYTEHGVPVLDCIVTVVDALRMQSEFGCGLDLKRKNIDEDDIENLVIQQIEFCNKILLNKASEVTPEELGRVHAIVRELQPNAEIVECDWGDVDLDSLLNTHLFNFDSVAGSATWIQEVEKTHDEDEDEEDEHDEHHHHDHDDDDHDHDHDEHGHHHHHDHEGGEVEEYGIGTYVYYARKALDINRFDWFVAKRWPKGVIRAKGICYFQDQFDTCYVFEQAGKQISLRNAGLWFGAMPKEELMQQIERDPMIAKDWDPYYGDRMQKLVFIGQHLDKEAIRKALDDCLVDPDTATI
jgi:G3E family GTPase